MSKYSPLPLEIASYKLTGGVDTKIQGLVLPPPKLQSCINAYVEQTGSIRRRFGRSALTSKDTTDTTITDPFVATGKHQTRLLGFTASSVYDYGEADGRFANRGRCASWRMQTKSVEALDSRGTTPGGKDMAILGSYKCYAYDYSSTVAGATVTTTAFSLVDSKGTRYASNQILATQSAAAIPFSSVKVVAFGVRFYIVFYDVTTVGSLKVFIINTTSAATIASSLAGSATLLAAAVFGGALDVGVSTGFGPCVAWIHSTAPNIGLGHITTAGAFLVSTTVAGVAAPLSISVDVTGSATTGVAYHVGTTPNDIYAKIMSFNGAAWSVVTTSGALDTAITAGGAVGCRFDSSVLLRIWYADTLTSYPCIRQATYSTGGAPSSRVALLPRSIRVSKAFLGADSSVYFWCMSEPFAGVTQPTLYLMRNDGVVSAMASQGVASASLLSLATGAPHVPVNASNEYSLITDQYATIGATGTLGALGTGTTSAMREIIVGMVDSNSHVTVEDGQCTYVPGGFLQQYDGTGVTEVGFLAFVDTQNRITPVSSNGAGSLTNAAGTLYSYHIVPEWTNAQGEREQGTDNGSKTTTAFALNDDTVVFSIDCIPWTLKKSPRTNLAFAVYRTLANPTSSSPFYRVGSVANDPTVDRVVFTDLMSDAVAATQEQFYAIVELDNVTPGSGGSVVAAGNGRVFVAGFPDDPNLVIYSKLRGHHSPLAFNDALTIPFPAAQGPITAMCVFAESLIVFTATAIYRVNGGGLSNTGTSGGYTDPVLVQSDSGAVGQRGLVVTPLGVIFESAKGKMVMDSSFTVQYIGAPLELLTDPGVCTGACLIPGLQQVRFSYAATTQVYDYYHQQWYVFTHHSDGPTCVWNDAHTAVSGGALVYDDPLVWTDAGTAYAVTLTLAWMHTASLMGDITVRSIGLTGQILDVSYLTLYVAKDQEATNQTIDNTLTASGPLSRQWRIKKQVLKQIEVIIRDAILDVYGADVVQATAAWRLEELSFELALRSPRFGRGPGTVVIGI